MSKRSPILGYNHNVRYRGLVFHVQTEDSGVLSPHLFTHLFHHGVIVSTRKLVYDAGSAEESIRSLMQAQHKAVLKDLRRGHFDDKIDSYLGGTPGLLPRGVDEVVERPSEIELAPSRGTVEELAAGAPTEQVLPMVFDEPSIPVAIIDNPPQPGPPVRSSPPPIPSRPRPALPFASRTTLASVDTTLKTEAPTFDSSPEIDLSPEIEIQLDVDDGEEATPPPRSAARDTQTPPLPGAQVPGDPRAAVGVVHEEARRGSTISDGIPSMIRPSSPTIPPVSTSDSRRPADRPSHINAATLPPARPISRPASRQALSPQQVVSRPLPSDDRSRRESEAVEVYSPAPSSAELPPERSVTYAQHKKSTRIPIDGLKNERSGGVAVPAGLGPPRRVGTGPTARPSTQMPPTGSAPSAIPRESSPRSGSLTEPLRARVPVPATSRTATNNSSGVVMTRPAVIVGAPAKTSGTIPRIRKAREDEGRGFGQGLISEKSLDEVILAYLSEDADEK